MFGISPLEFMALCVVALLVLGPEKLPRYAAEAGRWLRTVRRMAANAQEEVRRELGPEFQDISLQDLNPKTFVSRHLLEGEDFDLGLDDDEPARPARRNGSGGATELSRTRKSGAGRPRPERPTSEPARPATTGRRSGSARREAAQRGNEDARPAADQGSAAAAAASERSGRAPAASEPDDPPYDPDAT